MHIGGYQGFLPVDLRIATTWHGPKKPGFESRCSNRTTKLKVHVSRRSSVSPFPFSYLGCKVSFVHLFFLLFY